MLVGLRMGSRMIRACGNVGPCGAQDNRTDREISRRVRVGL